MSSIDDYKKLKQEMTGGRFRPVYLLHGEEGFFMDRLAEEIERLALQDHERDFNQTILYGRDCDPDSVKDTCLRFPMMAERQLVVVRELNAWRIDQVEKLETYLQKPTPTTILVLIYKHKKVDGRKGILKSVQKGGGVVFLSERLKEDKIPDLLITFAKQNKRKLGIGEAQLLAQHLGTDLSKAVKEVEKLCIVTADGASITSDTIQRFVGISKDHNIFELTHAIGARDVLKAQRIAQYFGSDPKDHPLVVTLGFLNTFFTKLAMVHQLAGKSQQEMAAAMKVNPYFLKDYVNPARNYPLPKLVEIQKQLRQFDLRSKGMGGDGSDQGELLRELLAKIMA
jgi:DNA polymerase III subunit delta